MGSLELSAVVVGHLASGAAINRINWFKKLVKTVGAIVLFGD